MCIYIFKYDVPTTLSQSVSQFGSAYAMQFPEEKLSGQLRPAMVESERDCLKKYYTYPYMDRAMQKLNTNYSFQAPATVSSIPIASKQIKL